MWNRLDWFGVPISSCHAAADGGRRKKKKKYTPTKITRISTRETMLHSCAEYTDQAKSISTDGMRDSVFFFFFLFLIANPKRPWTRTRIYPGFILCLEKLFQNLDCKWGHTKELLSLRHTLKNKKKEEPETSFMQPESGDLSCEMLPSLDVVESWGWKDLYFKVKNDFDDVRAVFFLSFLLSFQRDKIRRTM